MLASTFLPLAVAGLASAAELFNRQTQACSSGVHVIATGGGNSTDPYSYGLLGSLADSIVAAIPGSDSVSMPYDKEMVNAAAIEAGGVTLVQYVTEYHAACPNNKMVLIGYSSGAIITMNGICEGQIDQSLANTAIVATVVYGDQTRVPGQPYDLGTCTGSGNLTSIRNPALCGAFIPGIQSYCDTNDPQCCDGPPQDYEIHFVYPGEYDSVATQFVVSRFASAGGSVSSSSSSSSASATSSSTSSATSSSASATLTSSSVLLSSSTVASSTSTASISTPTVIYTNSSSSATVASLSTTVVPTTSTGVSTTPSMTSSPSASASQSLTLATGAATAALPSIFSVAIMFMAAIVTLC